MPIRFRCAYCNQLLGIARRKAGTVVRCPTCAGQVVVPTTDGVEDEEKRPGGQPLFERSDFDELFNNPQPADEASEPRTGAPAKAGTAAAGTAAPPTTAPVPEEDWGTHAEAEESGEPVAVGHGGPAAAFGSHRPPGIILSPAKATILTVAIVVGLAVAFAAGLLVGRFLLNGA